MVLVFLDEGQLVVCGWVDAALRSGVVFVLVFVFFPLCVRGLFFPALWLLLGGGGGGVGGGGGGTLRGRKTAAAL